LNGSGIIFLIAFTGYDTYSLQGTNFIIYSSSFIGILCAFPKRKFEIAFDVAIEES